MEKYHWDKKIAIQSYPEETARLIGKIGYSYAVAELGLDAFTPLKMTLMTILCETENVSYVVGGDWELPAIDPAGKHVLKIGIISGVGHPIVFVEVWLFPAFGLPKYHVVIGHFDLSVAKQKEKYDEAMSQNE